jgi:hypothetical protein
MLNLYHRKNFQDSNSKTSSTLARDLIILNSRRTVIWRILICNMRKVRWLSHMVQYRFFAWRNRRTKLYLIEIQTCSFDGHNKGDIFLFLITHKLFVEYEWDIAPGILKTIIYVCLWSGGLFYCEWENPKAPRIWNWLTLKTDVYMKGRQFLCLCRK